MEVTILIPTYNRKEELKRALWSVNRQTRPVSNCIIVDDGSTDGTDSMIEDMKKRVTFPIEYYYKINGGVLSARYYGLCHCDTEWVYPLDSDDELTDDAIEIFEKTWREIECYVSADCYGINALCWDTCERKIKGGKYPLNINKLSIQKYIDYFDKGERASIYKTDIIRKQYSEYDMILKEAYAEVGKTNFVPEGTLHLKYCYTNRAYCINKIVRIYHSENSDSLIRSRLTMKGCKINYFYKKYVLQNYSEKPNNVSYKMRYKYCVHLIKFGILLNKSKKEMIFDVGKTNRFLFYLAYPLGYLSFLLGQKI